MLDPAANARALGEIQRRGLRAAGELVDRLTAGGADGGEEGRATEANGASGTVARSQGGSPGGSPPADLLQLWIDVFQRGLQAMAAMARPDGQPPAGGESITTADLGRGSVTGAVPLTMRAARSSDRSAGSDGQPGRTGSAEVWLHNGTPDEMSRLRLHCGDLRAHDGSILPASALRFEPPSLDLIPARSSRGVVVVADVPDGAPGGVYRGVLLVAGAPDVWLPISVSVASRE